jgi:pimeloyl-ACP methyl ester carboxylesterase
MSTSADPTDTSLPGPRTWPLVTSAIAGLPLLRYRVLGGETNLVKELLAGLIAQGGDDPVDVEEWTRIVLYDLRERGGLNLRALRQHHVAVAVTRSRHPLLGTITAPTLVIHGEDDTFLPVEHGHRLAAAMPSASGLWLEHAGHPFPYPNMREVTEAILGHLAATDSDALGRGPALGPRD